MLGVNLAGAEFGEKCLPGIEGRDFVFNSEPVFAYFAAHGLCIFRIPFLWERMQPRLLGELNEPYLAGLRRNVEAAAGVGGGAILDLHNFGRYQGQPLASDGVSLETFADVWTRLSREFSGVRGVHAYGLMNEPHELDQEIWHRASQTALDAIRRQGDSTLVLASGLRWSNAHVWPKVNGRRSWIRDPAGNFAYEAHVYFDLDASGRYLLSYHEESRQTRDLVNIGVKRFEVFRQWCEQQGVRGLIGEFGVPNHDPRWLAVMRRFLDAVEAAGMDAIYWAAGEWWNDYALSVHPRENVPTAPQMALLSRGEAAPQQA